MPPTTYILLRHGARLRRAEISRQPRVHRPRQASAIHGAERWPGGGLTGAKPNVLRRAHSHRRNPDDTQVGDPHRVVRSTLSGASPRSHGRHAHVVHDWHGAPMVMAVHHLYSLQPKPPRKASDICSAAKADLRRPGKMDRRTPSVEYWHIAGTRIASMPMCALRRSRRPEPDPTNAWHIMVRG